MTKVFISSTWADLQEHRRLVLRGIDRLRHQGRDVDWIGMEAFSASNEAPSVVCRKFVTEADVYIGLFGTRYGSLDPGSGMSMTELEYRTAVELGKPRLLFLIDEQKAFIHPSDVEHDFTGRARLQDLKREVMSERVVDFFTTPEDLTSRVLTALEPCLMSPPASQANPELKADYENWMLDQVPEAAEFIGRRDELKSFQQILATKNVVVIEGMAGVGKTTVGARIAREHAQKGRQVFWINFDPAGKNTGEMLIWDLAAFLGQRKSPELWQFLAREADSAKPTNKVTRMGLMLQCLARGRYTLCFDDLQVVENDPDVSYFFSEIRKRLVDRSPEPPVQLLIMTRKTPHYLRDSFGETLRGFNKRDALDFLGAHGVQLLKEQFENLYARVEGNPQFLRLSLPGLPRQATRAALSGFIQGLGDQRPVRDYLMEKVYGALPDDLQRVLDALSIFSSPVSRDAVAEVLAGEGITGVMRSLDDLIHRHEIIETPKTQTVTLHSLVRDYCYDNLDRELRLRFHRKAAEYFAAQKDWIMAAYYQRQAREYDRAARLLIENASELVATGRLDTMLEQVKSFTPGQLTPERWVAVCQAKGNALKRRGEYEEAIASYQTALQVTTLAQTKADLHQAIGNCYHDKGNFDQALEHYREQLAIAEAADDVRGIAEAHSNMGVAFSKQANYLEAADHLKQAIQLEEKIGDPLLSARAHITLGLVYRERGDMDRAIASLNQSLEAYRRANKPELVAATLITLGHAHCDRGECDEAVAQVTEAIAIYEKLGDRFGLLVGYNNLGDLYRERGEHAQAVVYFEKSARIAESTGNDFASAVICSGLAETHLALGNATRALEYATRALELTKDVQSKTHEGVVHRELAEIKAALRRDSEAQQEYEMAKRILTQVGNQPDLARLYKSYGEFLINKPGSRDQSCDYLELALSLFQVLGARKEAEETQSIMQSYDCREAKI